MHKVSITESQSKTLIVLVGPTASGKTALSIELAQRLQAEILSADARQFYREIPIGTAQPTQEEQQGIPHHFLSFLPLDAHYTAGSFAEEALPKLTALFAKRDQVVVVGGSGLYIQALCRGIAPCPPVDPLVRAKLNDALATQGLPHLVELLQQKDPKYCVAADLKNPRRVLRALELCLSSGGTYSGFRQQLPPPRPFRVVQIGLLHPKEALHRRIEARTEAMMAQGFLEEAEKAYPYRSCNALQTLGYRELFRYMEGDCTLPEAVEQIKTNTKKYAKRQMTWFRQDATIRWFLPQEGASIWEWVAEKVANVSAPHRSLRATSHAPTLGQGIGEQ